MALAKRPVPPAEVRESIVDVPRTERDAWLDVVLGLNAIPDDGPELPRGCVPYLPCAVDALLEAMDGARVRADDVFVDVGGGVGRAAALVHLATGARAICIEIQPQMASAARGLAARLDATKLSVVEGDAVESAEPMALGTVFFLYCPFSGARLEKLLDGLESIARDHAIRICTVDVVLPYRPWLSPMPTHAGCVDVYWSKLHGSPSGTHAR